MYLTILKRIFHLSAVLMSCVVFAQNDFQGKAYYQSKTTVDMGDFGGRNMSEERKKAITARMKSALEKTFILNFNQVESLYEEEERLESTEGGGRGMRFAMMTNTGGDQYKNVKTQEFIQKQDLLGKQFLVKDSLQGLEWKLTGETKIIGKYTCFKAVSFKEIKEIDFRRPSNNEKPNTSETPEKKEVIAWYTPQIPVNQGPGDYWGLPGLILEVNAGNTTVLCSKIVINPTDKVKIKAPSKGKEVTQKEYDTIFKNKMEEMREMRENRGGRR